MLRPTSKLVNFSESVVKNLPLNPQQLKRYVADKCCPPGVSQADTALNNPPDSASPFKNNAFTPPDFLPITAYRPLCDPEEVLGPCAHKCKEYKNPEYFSYHRFSFFELQNATLNIAKCSQGGVLYEAESGLESNDECVESDGEADVLEEGKTGMKDAKECKDSSEKVKEFKDKCVEDEKKVETTTEADGKNCAK